MVSRIVIAAGLLLCAPPLLAQAQGRCDQALGLSKVMLQWKDELERARGARFLPAPVSAMDTDCVVREALFQQWFKALGGDPKKSAMAEPNRDSMGDCRRVVRTLEQWQELLVDRPGNPRLAEPVKATNCIPQRGGAGGGSGGGAGGAPAYKPGRIP